MECQGIEFPEKRTSCLAELWRHRADIAFLQETHFRTDKIPKLANKYFSTSYHSLSSTTKTKGTSILISKSLPWQFLEEYHDQEGRFLLLKGKICSQTFTLANIYLPNSNQLPVLQTFLSTLDSFLEGTLILGGDFNLTLDLHGLLLQLLFPTMGNPPLSQRPSACLSIS